MRYLKSSVHQTRFGCVFDRFTPNRCAKTTGTNLPVTGATSIGTGNAHLHVTNSYTRNPCNPGVIFLSPGVIFPSFLTNELGRFDVLYHALSSFKLHLLPTQLVLQLDLVLVHINTKKNNITTAHKLDSQVHKFYSSFIDFH